ncbi:uncharacterized protein M421DRAFT_339320 [Didymella exigua CBS 183.55]|uniref:Uncharacterized protein n=1 Tax=Didymella exigua CBS 183.55 TaxID=1150837 RepID=A0A6A5RVS5_9PLEO|nr:uncharacterized protein M421DRAFT_339320 [Didymella exigua CBS 183.55]KAF1931078.1 hypothetical protein M421DRAFT_339320 [Didymella exigua CBS 183.55]
MVRGTYKVQASCLTSASVRPVRLQRRHLRMPRERDRYPLLWVVLSSRSYCQVCLQVSIDNIYPLIMTCKCPQARSMQNTTHGHHLYATYRDTAITRLAADILATARSSSVGAAVSFSLLETATNYRPGGCTLLVPPKLHVINIQNIHNDIVMVPIWLNQRVRVVYKWNSWSLGVVGSAASSISYPRAAHSSGRGASYQFQGVDRSET